MSGHAEWAGNTEDCRYRCGAALARRDTTPVDVVAGIPGSSTGHEMGYGQERGVPFRRPFAKHTPIGARRFMPQDQPTRDLVARMRIIPIKDQQLDALVQYIGPPKEKLCTYC